MAYANLCAARMLTSQGAGDAGDAGDAVAARGSTAIVLRDVSVADG